jgi:hypothetical protein
VGLKILSINEEKIINGDISVKQQILYEIITNTTCIFKKKINKLKNFYSKKEINKLYIRNHKISI